MSSDEFESGCQSGWKQQVENEDVESLLVQGARMMTNELSEVTENDGIEEC